MAEIKLDHVTKIYPNGTQALTDLSFSVDKGEQVVVIGHNGSGKSTLFRVLSGFEPISEGKVRLFNQEVNPKKRSELREIRRRVGMVFQHFGLIDNISVFQNVLFGALGQVNFAMQTYNLFASKELRAKAMDALKRVGLEDYAKRRADQLSGGQKQRVSIARMLMQEPEIILADEPIASLDPKAGEEIMELLVSIAKERNLTLLMILHQLEIAKKYGDRMIVLQKGSLERDSHVSDIDQEFKDHVFTEDDEAEIESQLDQEFVKEEGQLADKDLDEADRESGQEIEVKARDDRKQMDDQERMS